MGFQHDSLCRVETHCTLSFMMEHIAFQDVNITGWSSINTCLFGYQCHDLPRLLMCIDRVKAWLNEETSWQVIQNYDMEHIAPHVGGTAFLLFLNTLTGMYDNTFRGPTVRAELEFHNEWTLDMKEL